MKQKNLLLKGILAVLLVFAVTFVACDNGSSKYYSLEDLGIDKNPVGNNPLGDGTVEEIKNIEVDELEDVEVEAIDGEDYGVEGAVGVQLSWVPVIAVDKYEVWRKNANVENGYEELVAWSAGTEFNAIKLDKGKWVARDYIKLDANNEPTLVEGDTYLYTVVAIPIQGRSRDSFEFECDPFEAPEMVAQDTAIAAPEVTLTIDAAAWKPYFSVAAKKPTSGFILPIAASAQPTLTFKNPKGTDLTSLLDADDKWIPTDWRDKVTEVPEGTYTATSSIAPAAFFNGFYKAAAATVKTIVHKQLFLGSVTTPDTPKLIATWDGYKMNNADDTYLNFMVKIALDEIRGLEYSADKITYSMERVKAKKTETVNVYGPDGTFASAKLFRDSPLSEVWNDGFVETVPSDMIPDLFGTFFRVQNTLYDRGLDLSIDDCAYFYRIKAVEIASGIEDYIVSQDPTGGYFDATLITPEFNFQEMVTLTVGATLDRSRTTDPEVTKAVIKYVVTPAFIDPFKGLLKDDAKLEFYFKLGGGNMVDTYLLGGYSQTEYTDDWAAAWEAAYDWSATTAISYLTSAKITFTKAEIESRAPKTFVIDALIYDDYYTNYVEDGIDDDDEILVTAFLVNAGKQYSLDMSGLNPAVSVDSTPNFVISASGIVVDPLGDGVNYIDDGAVRQYMLPFEPDSYVDETIAYDGILVSGN